jgi:tRNA(fMet)-specific endonuclease VapC
MANHYCYCERISYHFVNESVIIEISEAIADIYPEIDAFSQRRNPAFSDYAFATPRNMGKNDLWIASSAALLALKLVTTDSDFDHLDHAFIDVERINPKLLKL